MELSEGESKMRIVRNELLVNFLDFEQTISEGNHIYTAVKFFRGVPVFQLAKFSGDPHEQICSVIRRRKAGKMLALQLSKDRTKVLQVKILVTAEYPQSFPLMAATSLDVEFTCDLRRDSSWDQLGVCGNRYLNKWFHLRGEGCNLGQIYQQIRPVYSCCNSFLGV